MIFFVIQLQEDHLKANRDADEWKAREIVNDMAMRKVVID